jgi:hypothetical protein
MISDMGTGTLDFGKNAVLVWLAEGVEPHGGSFEAAAEVEGVGPVSWSRFDLALSYAMHAPRTDERLPWIKTGGRVIQPGELLEMFTAGEEALG